MKVRLQLRTNADPKTTPATFIHIIKNQGFLGLYTGISAALLRALTYSTVRFGAYEELKSRFSPKPSPTKPKPKLDFSTLLAMSGAAGFVGGVAGNAGDILNVRMQSDFAKPQQDRRNYKHAIDGLFRMIRGEGPASLFRGVLPNASRAVLMNASQLACYDLFKDMCLHKLSMKDNLVTHLTSSLGAGLVATTVCSPVDVVKTKVMSAHGKMSILQVVKDAFVNEGPLWIFRGWVPSFLRLGPQTIFMMVFFEQHKKVYRKLKSID